MTDTESAENEAGSIKGIRANAVSEWLEANIDGVEPPFRFELIVGGHSNLTYKVLDASGQAIVLRRPPTGSVLATAHDMAREHRIISAVGQSDVPVPRTLGLCEDVEVNDAPFYIMSYVEGTVVADGAMAGKLLDEPARVRLSENVADVLACLHNLDPEKIGLGDLARREAYIERQLKRWQGQWEKSKTRELQAMDDVHRALSEDIPEQQGYGIVHGDYRLGNMLVDASGQICAVLDWELCTLGDPLADLGYLLNNWAEEGDDAHGGGAAQYPTAVGGFLSRDELTARYAERSEREIRSVNYYQAFQYWRLAAIVEGVLSRYLKGVMGNRADTDVFKMQVDNLANSALELVRSD
jgi:aminoglycoside phosphotransferase (APT) family kinase protein